MTSTGSRSASLRTITLCAVLGLAISKTIHTPSGRPPKKFNYRYQRSGESIDAAASHEPYSTNEYGEFNPAEFDTAESASFGAYGPGGLGGYSGGIGFGSGLNQIGTGGFGFGNGFNGYSGGYTSGLGGGGYINQPGYYNGGQGLGGGYVQGPYISGGGYNGLHGHQQQVGGGYLDKNQYESAKKNAGDENHQKVAGNSASSANEGNQGYNQGAAQQSSSKGDSGFYKDQVANKKAEEDGKSYQGAQTYDKSGKKGEAENAAKSHKKGHVTKGFKTSHRKDEEEKTETFYDEAHDEADRKNFGQNQGAFGEKSAAAFKGGHENESLDAKAQAKEGHFNSQNKVEDSKATKGEYGQSAKKGNSEEFLKANGLGAQSILGHQESSGQYLQNKPYGILPIHGDKK